MTILCRHLFPFGRANLTTFFFKKIVIASNWIEAVVIRQSDVIASDRRECGNLNLLLKMKFPLSLRSSQRRLRQPRLVNNPGEYKLEAVGANSTIAFSGKMGTVPNFNYLSSNF